MNLKKQLIHICEEYYLQLEKEENDAFIKIEAEFAAIEKEKKKNDLISENKKKTNKVIRAEKELPFII